MKLTPDASAELVSEEPIGSDSGEFRVIEMPPRETAISSSGAV
jgi:hypothetical protein